LKWLEDIAICNSDVSSIQFKFGLSIVYFLYLHVNYSHIFIATQETKLVSL